MNNKTMQTLRYRVTITSLQLPGSQRIPIPIVLLPVVAAPSGPVFAHISEPTSTKRYMREWTRDRGNQRMNDVCSPVLIRDALAGTKQIRKRVHRDLSVTALPLAPRALSLKAPRNDG